MTTIPIICQTTESDEANCSLVPDNSVRFHHSKDDVNTTEALLQTESSLKALNRIAKKPPVNIIFSDIGYSIRSYTGQRRILHNISGEFYSGELSCILGPSGAGKSTLLNILSGLTNGFDGCINVNGYERDMRSFKKLSCYIMQDDLLQPRLTALESMQIAADLKLGTNFNKADKEIIVTEVLQCLGLWQHRHTKCEQLSGGQCKRLSIALELVNNPPVIFLDEPTTGLDIVSTRQIVVLLRLLSRQGRTIICTAHQPSASLFALFDNAYIVSNGSCCYQGSTALLVPFLAEIGYVCPTTHNPADFVIEAIIGGTTAAQQMSNLCKNGKIYNGTHTTSRLRINKIQTEKIGFPTSFTTQFVILIKRMYIQTKRNSINLFIQLMHHLICALSLGGIFYMVGNEGSTPMANYKFFLSVLVFFVYTHSMTPILLFPMEIRMIRREYFNHWYGLKAFYAARTCSTVPSMLTFGMLYVSIVYFLSGQLLEWDRFILFAIGALLTGFCSEGLGLIIGSAFNVTNGSIVGPATISPLLMLCCYGMGFGSFIEPLMKVLMSMSYLRYGLTAFTLPLYQNRTLMECNADVCPYADPAIILRDVGMASDIYSLQIFGLIMFTTFHRVIAYFILRHRLTGDNSNKFIAQINKFLKCS
ncbi:unnamed protein product [Parnassius mnemosyne]|uniref:ABC transporter domain-containing protein n=1 Tax=Parnassius mnemosyne TaxID=213953 RepID=A0AAV1M087_9NEOP